MTDRTRLHLASLGYSTLDPSLEWTRPCHLCPANTVIQGGAIGLSEHMRVVHEGDHR